MGGTLRRRFAITMILRLRSSVAGFALPGLRKENLELLPLSAWIELGQPLGERSSSYGEGLFEPDGQCGRLDRLKRTASEDRATVGAVLRR